MRPTLFISDLHLDASRPAVSELFFRFLHATTPDAEALYVLGDLFEYWVGDDLLDHDSLACEVASALKSVSTAGTRIFFMHGNRDFLIGSRFATEAGLALLPDPTMITLGDQRVLLLHGDTLCTDDVAYQQFRLQARNPDWQQAILSKPFGERVQLAKSIRLQSDSAKAGKSEEIMDVTPATVDSVFRANGYPLMIHGHTHRPARHAHAIDGRLCERIVLSDWDESGAYLRHDADGFTVHRITPETAQK